MSGFVVQLIAGVLVAAIAGLVGAAYQLHRRRSRPYAMIVSIQSDVIKMDTAVDLPSDVVKRLSDAAFLHRVEDHDALYEVEQVLRELSRLRDAGGDLRTQLEVAVTALRAAGDEPLPVLRAITPPLEAKFFDDFLMISLMRGRLALIEPPADRQEIVKVYELADEGGHLQIAIPGNPVPLGRRLNDVPFVRDALHPLVEALRTVDRDCLTHQLGAFATLLDAEFKIADAVEPELKALKERYSRWACHVYLANYGETAMLVMPRATLEVRHERFERPIRQPCHLVVYGKDAKGNTVSADQRDALLVSPSTHERFFFITSRLQKDMAGGNELRGRFKDRNSEARLVLDCVTAGVRSRKSVKTPWRPFQSADAE